MKKILLCLMAMMTMVAHAETTTAYEGTLTVKAMVILTLYEGESTVYVTTQDDGKYTLSLRDFGFELYGEMMNLGNINVRDIDGVVGDDGSITLSTSQTITIEDGDDPSIEWSGSMLGEISVTLSATMTATTLSATITIPVGMDITVTFEGSATDTGIATVESAAPSAATGLYTVDGKQVSAGYKGIVIENGRKVLVK